MCSPVNLEKFLTTSSFRKTSGELLLLAMESSNNFLWKETRTVCTFPGSTTVGLEVHCPTRNIHWKYFKARLKSLKKTSLTFSENLKGYLWCFFQDFVKVQKVSFFKWLFDYQFPRKIFAHISNKKNEAEVLDNVKQFFRSYNLSFKLKSFKLKSWFVIVLTAKMS